MKALGIGEAPLDISCVLASFPTENQKHDSQLVTKSVGGPVVAGLTLLQRLGCKTQLLTQLGSDVEGGYISEHLSKEGIQLKNLPTTHTKVNWYVVNARSGSRTGIKTTPGHQPIKNVAAIKIKTADIILLDRHELACMDQITKHKQAEAIVMIDPSTDTSLPVMKALKLATVPVVPVELVKKLFPTVSLLQASKQLAKQLENALVVTVGQYGSLVYQKGAIELLPAADLPCKDALGAGDVFRAALAYKLANHVDLLDAAAYANTIAGMQCQKVGNGTAIPHRTQLDNWHLVASKTTNFKVLNTWYQHLSI